MALPQAHRAQSNSFRLETITQLNPRLKSGGTVDGLVLRKGLILPRAQSRLSGFVNGRRRRFVDECVYCAKVTANTFSNLKGILSDQQIAEERAVAFYKKAAPPSNGSGMAGAINWSQRGPGPISCARLQFRHMRSGTLPNQSLHLNLCY